MAMMALKTNYTNTQLYSEIIPLCIKRFLKKKEALNARKSTDSELYLRLSTNDKTKNTKNYAKQTILLKGNMF